VDLITIDFETYYDKLFSLGRMSMEDYICGDQFELIMVGIKVNDQPATWHSFPTHDGYAQLFHDLGLANSAIICHNTLFDATILQHHFGIVPRILLDTLCMAQAVLKPYHRSISLASCLKVLNCPIQKLDTVHNMLGRTLSSLTKQELDEYGLYCTTDVEGTYWLFQQLVKQIPAAELEIIDLTMRMYVEPVFELDAEVLRGVLQDERDNKRRLIANLPPNITASQLSSNPQFAKVLESLGVDPPMKVSPTTGKPTFAFAKNDPEWKQLEDDYGHDPLLGPVLMARLGLKSTISETRAERFLNIAEDYGKLRVPLRYYAAHTGRYGGMEKINCQNLPRIDYDSDNPNQLRHAIRAPEGYSVLAGDLSQIEARLNAWLSGCDELLRVFAEGGDPYCAFASKAYGRPITKADQHERFIGKTCILGLGYGMGWLKLRSTLRAKGVNEEQETVQRYVDVYRTAYHQIPALWKRCDGIIESMASGGNAELGPCIINDSTVLLPNDMFIAYPNLKYVASMKYEGWWYEFAGMGRTMWGGKLVENIIQSLARIIIMGHMLEVKNRLGLRPALQAHDELVYIVPTEKLNEYNLELLRIMKTVPDWAAGLPVDAETGFGKTYGEAK
jgi:DNA polymerase